MTLAEQIRCLVTHGIPRRGDGSLQSVASEVGISYQTLMNLLHGKTDNPQLNTIRSLSMFYGISLAYFDCESPQDCLRYLQQHSRIQDDSPLTQQLLRQARHLSPTGQRNLEAILDWIRFAERQT